MADQWQQINSLFLSAIELSEAERATFLASACGDDEELRRDVESLLASHDQASHFLEEPLIEPGGLTSPGGKARGAHAAAEHPSVTDPGVENPAGIPPTLSSTQMPTEGRGNELGPGSRIAHYRIERRLGTGGMGEVFAAWDLALDRAAAIKVIRPGFDASFTGRLRREVEACARLQHPGIATFFEGGEENGRTYFAMELVEGTTLRKRLKKTIPPAEALAITTGLLEALAHAHAAGVLHRDIKPENIVISGGGTPKLLDFGLARSLGEADLDDPSGCAPATLTALTAHGTVAGTPGYMSPEQLRREPLGPASDLFQVATVLYEMLTGRRAFGEGPVVARVGATLAGVPDLSPLIDTPAAGIATVLRRALATRPADRFASAGAFLLALDRVAEGRVRTLLPDSIVIVDFTDEDADISNEWIGGALAESLGGELSRAERLQVMGRAQIMREAVKLRECGVTDSARIALAVGGRWVVDGRFRRTGDQLHLSYRLVDAATRVSALGGEIRGTVRHMFELADQLAQAIADGLRVRRGSHAGSGSTEHAHAFELQARARQIWRHAGRVDSRVIDMLEEAVDVSPDCAPALGAFVGALAGRYIASGDCSDLERAIAMSERAIAVDPNNSEVWTWRGYAFFRLDRLTEALEALDRAVTLGKDEASPFYMYGSTLQTLGRPEEARSYLQRAVTLDPTFSIAWLSLGWTLSCSGQYDEARYAYGRAKALEGRPGPTMVAGLGGYIADCLRCQGRFGEARREALEGLEAVERSDFSYRDTIRALCLGALGRSTLLLDDRAAAQAAFSQAIAQMRGRSRTQAGGHVLVHALAGFARATNDAAAFEEGQRIFESRAGYSFKFFFGCTDDFTLLELARTAHAIGRAELAASLLARARAAGCRERFSLAASDITE